MADPLWINASAGAPAYSASELRQAMALPLMYGGRNLGARQGVRPGGNQLQVSLAGSVITVQPGLMCVDPGLTTPQGPYWVAIPAAETHNLTAANPTNPRKDIIIGRVYDHDEDSSGLRLARTEYLAGVASGTPAEQPVPAGAFRIATIDVPANGSPAPSVTNNFPFTVAAGGLVPVRSQAERDALTAVAYDGLACWRQDRDWIEIYDGTAWRVQGVAKVSSTGDLSAVTNPYSGQVASNTGDNLLYRYNGSAWIPQPGLISSQTLGAPAANVPFNTIPTGFRELELRITARGAAAAQFVNVRLQFNGDTGNNYDNVQVFGSGNSANAGAGEVLNEAGAMLGDMPGSTTVAGSAASFNVSIPAYNDTNFWQQTISEVSLASQTAGGQANQLWRKSWAGRWRNAAAIASILVINSSGNFAAGSRFDLHGK